MNILSRFFRKLLKLKPKEYILCSAIWYDDKVRYEYTPINIKSGMVFSGYRHSCIYESMKSHYASLFTFHKRWGNMEAVEGFLTSYNRFVERTEGATIAYKAGQVGKDVSYLFSEDLYSKEKGYFI